jgi:hypothetical protein
LRGIAADDKRGKTAVTSSVRCDVDGDEPVSRLII